MCTIGILLWFKRKYVAFRLCVYVSMPCQLSVTLLVSVTLHVCVACARSTKLLLNIVRPADVTPCDEHRLIWCPYMPEDDEQSTSTGTTLPCVRTSGLAASSVTQTLAN